MAEGRIDRDWAGTYVGVYHQPRASEGLREVGEVV